MDSRKTPTDFQSTVDILVGPSQTKHVVHKDILCQKCEYFQRMFDPNSDWEETTTGTIRWPDVDELAFRCFVACLYNPRDESALAVARGEYGDVKKWHFLASVWVLADRFLCPSVQDRAVDMLRELSWSPYGGAHIPDAAQIQATYELLPLPSKFRRAFVHVWLIGLSNGGVPDEIATIADGLPVAFMEDLTRMVAHNQIRGTRARDWIGEGSDRWCSEFHCHTGLDEFCREADYIYWMDRYTIEEQE